MKVDDTFLIQDLPQRTQSVTHLRVGAFEPKSFVAGPGTRAVLWVTGCDRRCPGCIKPEFLPFEAGIVRSVDEVASQILACPAITGVTYSGGEPFEQSAALGALSQILRSAQLDILSYSGYRLEDLQLNPAKFEPLLEQLDWLIDGEYQATQFGPLQYLGSENQRLLKRQSDGSFVSVSTERKHDVQISLTSKGMRFTGFPNASFEHNLRQALATRGIILQRAETDDGSSP